MREEDVYQTISDVKKLLEYHFNSNYETGYILSVLEAINMLIDILPSDINNNFLRKQLLKLAFLLKKAKVADDKEFAIIIDEIAKLANNILFYLWNIYYPGGEEYGKREHY
uniref:p12-8p n=1 Tax=Pyrococcus sp. 12/1 TaxID=758582 RepID=D6MY14_9EURY|nr:hypothetical protein [Pyrococcus sp. 12/1]ADF80215.1 p12-8p [Pyrococcus sp. 12/1]